MTFGGKDNRGPSIAELQRYVRDKVDMIFVLNTGENIVGKLRWFDENAFSVTQDGQQPFTILRSAVVGYRKNSPGENQPAATAKTAAPIATSSQEQLPQPASVSTEERKTDDLGA